MVPSLLPLRNSKPSSCFSTRALCGSLSDQNTEREMGFSKMSQAEGGLDCDGKKWVIAGISIRASLKPVNTKIRGESEQGREEGERSTTPTAKEAKIPAKLKCPPAPTKRRPALRCRSSVAREFFAPPDNLETVFIRR
ncbi:PREDICTED: uncharacterized protein LOC104825323 [Tarenaya hassleriana]|uniref:uncharacterized protein LOC104825323 n=1 Tax=Tarenaya hassleriana TaxID=28532 RepID=UPI00053C59B4|nr:PREDICTED: uncharacterized protein LOC104825323 [Tarenaya hassleriana]